MATNQQKHNPTEMIHQHKVKMLWTYFANIMLGMWLLASPLAFVYESSGLLWSDILSGAFIVLFGILALFPKGDFLGRWGICFVGIWLLFAPLIFWSPTAFVYANDTLVGALVIAFSILVPMMPGREHHKAMMEPGPDIPSGWSYNPSSWWQRGPMIALGFISFLLARHMTAFQLEHTRAVWEPFFQPGTAAILTSSVSRAFPVSDAGLGAVAYLLETLSGFMGGTRRWRTMPWMVLMFFILVVPLGITSIVLVILQPIAIGTWCTLCLATALFMLIMIPLALDEVIAMFQFLAQAKREGKPVWRTFWVGGTIKGDTKDTRSPEFTTSFQKAGMAMIWGVTIPWNLFISTLLGIWLMAVPAVLGSQGIAADNAHLVGALIVTVSIIAMAEVARPIRFLNILFGIWLVAAPFILTGFTASAHWNTIVIGSILIFMSIRRGNVYESYGRWDRYIV